MYCLSENMFTLFSLFYTDIHDVTLSVNVCKLY